VSFLEVSWRESLILSLKIKQRTEAEQLKHAFAAGMAELTKPIPQSPTRDLIAEFMPAIPHLKEVANYLTAYLKDDYLMTHFQGIGRLYEAQGLYMEAENWYNQCLTISQKCFGLKHLHVANSLYNLAYLYYINGRYNQAENFQIQALEMRKTLLGNINLDVADSLNDWVHLTFANL
jgi:tetratricopeptide (TPR) repeat protein